MPSIAVAKRYLWLAYREREDRIVDYRKRGLSLREIAALESMRHQQVADVLRQYDRRMTLRGEWAKTLPPALFRTQNPDGSEKHGFGPH